MAFGRVVTMRPFFFRAVVKEDLTTGMCPGHFRRASAFLETRRAGGQICVCRRFFVFAVFPCATTAQTTQGANLGLYGTRRNGSASHACHCAAIAAAIPGKVLDRARARSFAGSFDVA